MKNEILLLLFCVTLCSSQIAYTRSLDNQFLISDGDSTDMVAPKLKNEFNQSESFLPSVSYPEVEMKQYKKKESPSIPIHVDNTGDSKENATMIYPNQQIIVTMPEFQSYYLKFNATANMTATIKMTSNSSDYYSSLYRIDTISNSWIFMTNGAVVNSTSQVINQVSLTQDSAYGVMYSNVGSQARSLIVVVELNRQQDSVAQDFFSLSHLKQQDVISYMKDKNLVFTNNHTINIEQLRVADPKNYLKASALVILGLINQISLISPQNQTLTILKAKPFIQTALNVFSTMNKTRLKNGLYLTNGTLLAATDTDKPFGGFKLTLFQENVYAIAATIELFRKTYVFNKTMNLGITANDFNVRLRQLNSTINQLQTVFRDGSTNLYVRAAFVDTSGILQTRTDDAYVESNAYFAKILQFNQFLYYFYYDSSISPAYHSSFITALTTEGDNIIFSLEATVRQTIVPFTPILPNGGIVPEYYNITTASPSINATLMAQIYYLGAIRPGFFRLVTNDTIVSESSDFLYNTILLFQRDGVMVNKISLLTGVQSNNSYFYENIWLVDQIRQMLSFYESRTDGSLDDESRTWRRFSVTFKQDIDSKFLDKVTNAYFSQYDYRVALAFRGTNTVQTSGLVANAYAMRELNLRYPLSARMVSKSKSVANSITDVTLEIGGYITNFEMVYQTRVFTQPLQLSVELIDESGKITETYSNSSYIVSSDQSHYIKLYYTTPSRGLYSLKLSVTLEGEKIFLGSINLDSVLKAVIDSSIPTPIIYSHELSNSQNRQIRIIDTNGNSAPDLQVDVFLTGTNQSISTVSALSQRNLVTDPNGVLTFTLDTSNIMTLFNIDFENKTEYIAYLLINSTNYEALNLVIDNSYLVVPVTIILSHLTYSLTPNILEIEQGSLDDLRLTFSVTNNQNEAVSDVDINVVYKEVIGFGTTSVSGTSIITISAKDLQLIPSGSQLLEVDLANHNYPIVVANQTIVVLPNALSLTNTGENSYEVETASYKGIINDEFIPNDFKGNPPSEISFRVTATNSFGRSEIADLELSWDSNFKKGYLLEFSGLTTQEGSNIITIRSGELDIGEYNLIISAHRTGLTEEKPVEIAVHINVVRGQFTGPIITGIVIVLGFLASGIMGKIIEYIKVKLKRLIICPNCSTPTGKSHNACHSCGNRMPGKSLVTSLHEKANK